MEKALMGLKFGGKHQNQRGREESHHEAQEGAQSLYPRGSRCPCHPFPAPTLQVVPEKPRKGSEQWPLNQGNIHTSNFMNLLKVLAEFVL